MLDERQQRLNLLRSDLAVALNVSKERITNGKNNESRVQEYREKKDKIDIARREYTECGNHLKDIYKNIQSYARQHQDSARAILDLAIATAGSLVPDANTDGIHLQSEANNRVSIVNGQSQDINLREGGGYRAILGALLRYACLKAQPDALQFMLFDESFFTLSDTSTQYMKDIFMAMKKDATLVCIEQRRNAMDGVLDSEYTFRKDDAGTTTVSKTL